jgi:hypothetical protein
MLMLVFRKVTGSAVCNVTSDVGSDSALLLAIQLLSALPDYFPAGVAVSLAAPFSGPKFLVR